MAQKITARCADRAVGGTLGKRHFRRNQDYLGALRDAGVTPGGVTYRRVYSPLLKSFRPPGTGFLPSIRGEGATRSHKRVAPWSVGSKAYLRRLSAGGH